MNKGKKTTTHSMVDDQPDALEILSGIYIVTGDLTTMAERLEYKYRALLSLDNTTETITAIFKDGGRFVTKDNDNLYIIPYNTEPIVIEFNDDKITYNLIELQEAICNNRVVNMVKDIKEAKPDGRVYSLEVTVTGFSDGVPEVSVYNNILFDDLINKITINEKTVAGQLWGVVPGFYNRIYKITYLM